VRAPLREKQQHKKPFHRLARPIVASSRLHFVTVGIRRYTVVDKLGQGTFGQVMKCETDDKEGYAIKIIRNKPAYTNQALVENLILSMVGPENPCHLLPTNHHFLPLCRRVIFVHCTVHTRMFVCYLGMMGMRQQTVSALLRYDGVLATAMMKCCPHTQHARCPHILTGKAHRAGESGLKRARAQILRVLHAQESLVPSIGAS